MFRISESSALPIAAAVYDATNLSTLPASAQYRIDDDYSHQNVVGWTALTPGASMLIATTAIQNSILNRSNSVERRTITLQTDDGLSTECSATFQYEILRIDGLLN